MTGVILDSGGVLLRPKRGVWLPHRDFDDVLAAAGVAYDEDCLAGAHEVAYAYLDEVHSIPMATEAEEVPLWTRYYELLLDGLGLDTAHASAIAASVVTSTDVEPLEWTIPVLTGLRARDVPVVILSDAWPHLRRWYDELGLAPFVTGMVISAEQGITKPDPRVFASARSLLPPVDDVVFVDDYAYNARAAGGSGMRGVWLRRDDESPVDDVASITDLRELLEML